VSDDLDRFVVVHAPSLVRFGYLLTQDGALAEDLAQEVLTQVVRTWPQVRDVENPQGYLRRMVVNAATNWRRRARNREVPTSRAVEPPEGVDDVAQVFADRDLMWGVLAGLPTRQRAVLVLRFYEGLTEAEIARLLDCAPGTVRSLAARAFATLRAHPQLARPSTGDSDEPPPLASFVKEEQP
jgi:RNA polymerase sigma-70 factor (sigma-E family)